MNTRSLISSLALSLSAAACGGVEPMDSDLPVEPADPTDPAEPTDPPAPKAGTLDFAYGSKGVARVDAVPGYPAVMAVQGDKLVVCSTALTPGGTVATLTRIGLDGAVDTSFGIDDEGHTPIGTNSSCRQMGVRPDGSIVAHLVYAGGPKVLMRLDANGRSINADLVASTLRGMNLEGNMLLGAYLGSPSGQLVKDAEHPADAAAIPQLAGTPLRPFSIAGKHVQVGTYTVGGVTGWGVIREAEEGSLGMPSELVSAGTDEGDIMLDAIALPDGSILAVGGADQNKDAMLVRFPPTGPASVLTQQLGLTSTARSAIVDGAGRAIVVGSATIEGKTQLAWQRLDAEGLEVDTSYADGGTVIAPAPSGSGELVGAVRHGGAIYLLAMYDVEQPEPKTALLKIVE